MEEFRQGLGDAFASIASFVPKLLGFLLILVLGYFIGKAVARILDSVLERVGFDKMVERGGVKQALAKSKYDASDILTKILFWVLFLFVLQLAFGVFDPNPISNLIMGVISYLPKVFVAIVIIVLGAALAAAAKEIIEAALGGLRYGRTLGFVASAAILMLAVFAALNQLQIAPYIVNGLFTAILAIIVGSAIVSIGGGGIQTMSGYWQRASQRVEQESQAVKQEAEGASDRIQQRAQERKDQVKQGSQGGATRS